MITKESIKNVSSFVVTASCESIGSMTDISKNVSIKTGQLYRLKNKEYSISIESIAQLLSLHKLDIRIPMIVGVMSKLGYPLEFGIAWNYTLQYPTELSLPRDLLTKLRKVVTETHRHATTSEVAWELVKVLFNHYLVSGSCSLDSLVEGAGISFLALGSYLENGKITNLRKMLNLIIACNEKDASKNMATVLLLLAYQSNINKPILAKGVSLDQLYDN